MRVFLLRRWDAEKLVGPHGNPRRLSWRVRWPNELVGSDAFNEWRAPQLRSGIGPGLRAQEVATHQIQPAGSAENIQWTTMTKCRCQFQQPLVKPSPRVKTYWCS